MIGQNLEIDRLNLPPEYYLFYQEINFEKNHVK